MTSRYRLLAMAVALAGSLTFAGIAFAAAPVLQSATAVPEDNGQEIQWTVTLSQLTLGSTLTFQAGPRQAALYLLDEPAPNQGTPVTETVTKTHETFTFVSGPVTDQDGNSVAAFYLQARESVPDQEPIYSNILSLQAVGQVPEVPLAAGLPVVLAGVGAWAWRRQRAAARTSVRSPLAG
jgi:hypothetical protein